MRSASTWMPEKVTQTPSPSPDLIPAKNLTRNSHFDWYGKRGHFKLNHIPKRQRPHSLLNVAFIMPATTYSPTHFRVQYNRPGGA